MGSVVIAIRLNYSETMGGEEIIKLIEKIGEVLACFPFRADVELVADIDPKAMVILGQAILYAQLKKMQADQKQEQGFSE